MRLTCPNCQAQYEVDDSAIPEAGRDVQCSNCKQTWFQEKPGRGLPPRDSVVASEPRVKSGSVEDSILGILREEAEREQRARAEDREAANTAVAKLSRGMQEPNPEAEAKRSDGPDLGQRPDVTPAPAPAQAEPAAEEPAAAEEPDLTDQVRISAALKQATDSLPPVESPAAAKEKASGRSGFSSGFTLVIVLFGLGMVCYTFSSTIVEYVPQAEPYLADYIVWVDQMRLKLDEQLIKLTAFIEAQTQSE